MAAIHDHPSADYHFYQIALQYYATGRFAALAGLIPVSGNLIHHAVEMMLKGHLAHTCTLAQMAANPYCHRLPRIWQAFKALFLAENLTPSALDKFVFQGPVPDPRS